jgi:hypothetical protein
MNPVVKTLVSLVAASGGLCILACNNGNAVPQAIIASNVQPAGGTGMCISPEPFVWVPQTSSNPTGPDTSDNTLVTTTGTGDIVIQCSVIPSGNGYNVTLTAQITGGKTPGTLTIGPSIFTPRTRDATGKPTSDSTTIPNITADFLDATKHLRETDCTAQYVLADTGSPGASLPSVADTFADDKGGRIWVSVFCPTPKNLDTDKPGNESCKMSTTFRFENCASKAQ